jgi:hypothetical protein
MHFDEFIISLGTQFGVIPAKAGIQLIQNVLDPGFRRGDDQKEFLGTRQFKGAPNDRDKNVQSLFCL